MSVRCVYGIKGEWNSPTFVEEENQAMEHGTSSSVVCATSLSNVDLERREHRCAGCSRFGAGVRFSPLPHRVRTRNASGLGVGSGVKTLIVPMRARTIPMALGWYAPLSKKLISTEWCHFLCLSLIAKPGCHMMRRSPSLSAT